MRLTNKDLKQASEAVAANSKRPDCVPVNSIANVFALINLWNSELKRKQGVWNGYNLEDITLPELLSKFLESRCIKFDVSNDLQTNLRSVDAWYDTKTNSVKPYYEEGTIDIDLGSKSISAKISKLPDSYDYENFKNDLASIRKSMNIRDYQYPVSLKSAISDVDVMQIVDKIVFKGRVNWSGKEADIFIPYYVSEFSIGLSEEDYSAEIARMISAFWVNNILNVFG